MNPDDFVARALEEDVGAGDVTTEATVPAAARARARIVQKQPGVAFGFDLVEEAMRQCGVEHVDRLVVEGQWRDAVPAEVLLASGPARAILVAERTALNFLGHLSGIATLTATFVEAVAGTGTRILDTRKTTPGLRALEKAAVAAGGGTNHRQGHARSVQERLPVFFLQWLPLPEGIFPRDQPEQPGALVVGRSEGVGEQRSKRHRDG